MLVLLEFKYSMRLNSDKGPENQINQFSTATKTGAPSHSEESVTEEVTVSDETLRELFKDAVKQEKSNPVESLKTLVISFAEKMLMEYGHLSSTHIGRLKPADLDMNYGNEDILEIKRPFLQPRKVFHQNKRFLIRKLNDAINSSEYPNRRWGLVGSYDCGGDSYVLTLNAHKEPNYLPNKHTMETLFRSQYCSIFDEDIVCNEDQLIGFFVLDQFREVFEQSGLGKESQRSKEKIAMDFLLPDDNAALEFTKLINKANNDINIDSRIGLFRPTRYETQDGSTVFELEFQPSIGNKTYTSFKDSVLADKANLLGFIQRLRIPVSDEVFSRIYSKPQQHS